MPELSPQSQNQAAAQVKVSEKFLHQTEPKRLRTRHPPRRTPPHYPTIWPGAPLPLYTQRTRVQTQLSDQFRGAEIPGPAPSWQADCHLFSSCLFEMASLPALFFSAFLINPLPALEKSE